MATMRALETKKGRNKLRVQEMIVVREGRRVEVEKAASVM
jgi:hypothetical protein